MFLSALGIACMTVGLTTTLNVIPKIKYYLNVKRLKPLDCEICLGFWLGLIYGIIYTDIPQLILLPFISSILSLIIKKIIT